MALQFGTEYDRMMAANMMGHTFASLGSMLPGMGQAVGKGLFGYTDPGFKGTGTQFTEQVFRDYYNENVASDPAAWSYIQNPSADPDDQLMITVDDYDSWRQAINAKQGSVQAPKAWMDHPEYGSIFSQGSPLMSDYQDAWGQVTDGSFRDETHHQGLLGMPGSGKGKLAPLGLNISDKEWWGFDLGNLGQGVNTDATLPKFISQKVPKAYNQLDQFTGGLLPNIGEMAYKNYQNNLGNLSALQAERKQLADDGKDTTQIDANIARLQRKVNRKREGLDWGAASDGQGMLMNLWGPKAFTAGDRSTTPLASLMASSPELHDNLSYMLSKIPEAYNKDGSLSDKGIEHIRKFAESTENEDLKKWIEDESNYSYTNVGHRDAVYPLDDPTTANVDESAQSGASPYINTRGRTGNVVGSAIDQGLFGGALPGNFDYTGVYGTAEERADEAWKSFQYLTNKTLGDDNPGINKPGGFNIGQQLPDEQTFKANWLSKNAKDPSSPWDHGLPSYLKGAGDFVSDAYHSGARLASQGADAVSGAANSIWDMTTDAASGAINKIEQGVDTITQGSDDFKDLHPGLFNNQDDYDNYVKHREEAYANSLQNDVLPPMTDDMWNTLINAGPEGIKSLQRAIGLTGDDVDGKVGGTTKQAYEDFRQKQASNLASNPSKTYPRDEWEIMHGFDQTPFKDFYNDMKTELIGSDKYREEYEELGGLAGRTKAKITDKARKLKNWWGEEITSPLEGFFNKPKDPGAGLEQSLQNKEETAMSAVNNIRSYKGSMDQNAFMDRIISDPEFAEYWALYDKMSPQMRARRWGDKELEFNK
jgi:hypothetical protein